MTERPKIEGVNEAELEAITREIHAQLRASYGLAPEEASDPTPAREPGPKAGNVARFVAAFLVPPLMMVGLLLLLRMVKDGF